MMQEIKQILIKYWGYSHFISKQESIIKSVMQGKDTLALLPTGGGKSICYQIPGMVLGGITLVITPLIALMKDQVENLKKRHIKAVALYSSMTKHEYDLAINQCTHGDTHFLYLSPERLTSGRFLEILPSLDVKLIAVDEAHCISQWGYDFRPPYLEIANIRPLFPKIPIIALTATATPQVSIDIQNKLEFKKDSHFIKDSFSRKNLIYFVSKEENKLAILLQMAHKQKGSGIVYVRNRKKAKELADFLTSNNTSATYYHAGLDSRLRDQRQKAWKQGDTRIIVATNAFGMGIDKENVRFVIHMDLPDNPESYFQEAGRAGRDGERAFSVILWEDADIKNLKNYFKLAFPPTDIIKRTYQALGNYFNLATGAGKGQSFDSDIVHFSKQYNQNSIITFNSIKFIENQGLIAMNDAYYKPSKIRILLNGNDLYRFQVDYPRYDNFIKFLLRTYSGLFQSLVDINENQIKKIFNITSDQVRNILKSLSKINIIEYIPENNSAQITFVSERLSNNDFYISKTIYDNKKQAAYNRLTSMIDYVSSKNHCRSQLLLSYFGENNSKRCGSCDICIKRNKTELSELEFDEFVNKIKPLLRKKPMHINDLVLAINSNNNDKLLNALQWLQDNGKIEANSEQKLYWI